MRIYIFILTISLLLSLVSCARSAGGPAETSSADIIETAAATEYTDSLEARKTISDDLENKDYGGASFRMIYQKRYAEYQYSEELNGDILNDAVYNRNLNVESRFNVKIEHNEGAESDLASHLVNTVLSGSDEYDLYMGHALFTGSYIGKGVYADWNTTDIDFTKPWFPQYAIKNLTLNDRMYLTVSDICLSSA